jgi:hypothetical protein
MASGSDRRIWQPCSIGTAMGATISDSTSLTVVGRESAAGDVKQTVLYSVGIAAKTPVGRLERAYGQRRSIAVLTNITSGRCQMAVSSSSETGSLISSTKVEGTAVENPQGEDLGSIREVMIDKVSGQVVYAVLKYGSFLGMGGKLFALPWELLEYDTERGAYVIDLPQDQLRDAPSYAENTQPDWSDPAWNKSVYDYYGSDSGRFRF